MENFYTTNHGKKAIEEELIRGHNMANQLLEVLTLDYNNSNKKLVKESILPLSATIAHDLVREVLKSFTNTLLLLNKKEYSKSNDVKIPINSRDFSFSTNNFPKVEEDLDGISCKKLKTLTNTKNPKGSNKRKSISPTWEKSSSILIDDGHTWRKYGQKRITNAKYFRNYYRCTNMYDQHCEAIKHVQRTQDNPPLYMTTYYGHHTCKNSNFHSDMNFEPFLSSHDSSILLSFDNNNVSIKQEYPLPPVPMSPLLTSTKKDPIKESYDDHFPQKQLFSQENILLCEVEACFDYLRHVIVLSPNESFEFEDVYDQM